MSLTEQYRILNEQLFKLNNLLHKELEKYFEFEYFRDYTIYRQYTNYRQYTKDGITIQISLGCDGGWTISFPYDTDCLRKIHGYGDDLKCTALEVLNKTYVFEQ
jgi:hypothetical protein